MSVISNDKRPVVAVFDFDGTLTFRDSFLLFLLKTTGYIQFVWGMLYLSPVMVCYGLKLIPNWQAKERFLRHFFRGWTREDLQRLANIYAYRCIPRLLNPKAIARLRWHQQQKHHIILLSASLEAYLSPWAEQVGIDQVIGTRLEIQGNVLTGRIDGKNCYGSEKVKRLTQVLGDLNSYCIHAYGDSRGDLPLLNCVTYPYYRTF